MRHQSVVFPDGTRLRIPLPVAATVNDLLVAMEKHPGAGGAKSVMLFAEGSSGEPLEDSEAVFPDSEVQGAADLAIK